MRSEKGGRFSPSEIAGFEVRFYSLPAKTDDLGTVQRRLERHQDHAGCLRVLLLQGTNENTCLLQRNPHQQPPISLASPRPAASHCCSERTPDLSNRSCQQSDMAVSAVQWRNADRTKPLRSPTGIPVQASRQLVEQGTLCDPITCPRARPYWCLWPQIEPLPHRPHSVLSNITRGTDLLKDLKGGFPCQTYERSDTPVQQHSSRNTLLAP
jgi:hypothetical protein